LVAAVALAVEKVKLTPVVAMVVPVAVDQVAVVQIMEQVAAAVAHV
jgi:hypothetical protein